MQNAIVAKLIQKLNLQPHPEGGSFVEAYRSKCIIPVSHEYEGDTRASCTHIYYLLADMDFSAWHKVKSDEIWHLYAGGPLTLFILQEDGGLSKVILGNPLEIEGAVYQYVVEKNQWFAASVDTNVGYALVGCTVSPGFDYRDWEMADAKELTNKFPQHVKLINKYTRQNITEETSAE